MKLPVYQMVINPDIDSDVEVSYVAFVDKPAIERNFLAFKDQKVMFAVNEEDHIVSGPAMIAESLIYRKDDQGEYNVFFSADTIGQIALKFFKKDFQKNLNLFHDPSLSLVGVTIFESFVTSKKRGIQPMKGFEDLPDGTWFISAKVENEAVWQAIKDGKVKGFSVEGIFSYVKKERILNGLSEQIDHLKETSFMSEIKNDLKELVKTLKLKFFGGTAPLEFTLKDNSKVSIDKLEIGGKVMIGDKEAPEGKLEFQDGSSVNVGAGGVISAVNPVQQMAKDYTTKDGKTLNIDNLAAGGVVLIAGAPAPDGDYELADGTKLSVAGGAITAVMPAMSATDPAAQMEAMRKDVERLSGILKTIESYKIDQYKTQLEAANTKIAKQEETIKGMFEIVEKLASAPAGNPVGGSNHQFVSDKIKGREERLQELSQNLNNLKKLKTA